MGIALTVTLSLAQPKKMPTILATYTHVSCPVVDGAPRQSCKTGDSCVAVTKSRYFDCLRPDKSRYASLAICGRDTECKSDEACDVEGHCQKVNNRPKSCSPAFPGSFCLNDQKCASDGSCSYTVPATGKFIGALAVSGCNGGEPCHGTEVCGRTARCDCPGGVCMKYRSCDTDQDGHLSLDCGGDDCDDDDSFRFPGNPEICTGKWATHDEDCNPMTVANASFDFNQPSSPWNVNRDADPSADADKDGWISVGCSNPYTNKTPPKYPMGGVFYDPIKNIVTGDDCNDNDTNNNPGGGPICTPDGKFSRSCMGSSFNNPSLLSFVEKYGGVVAFPYVTVPCPQGCVANGRGCF